MQRFTLFNKLNIAEHFKYFFLLTFVFTMAVNGFRAEPAYGTEHRGQSTGL